MASYANRGHVDINDCFGPSLLFDMLSRCEYALLTNPGFDPTHTGTPKKTTVPSVLIHSIPLLETLHKSLVFYIWLAFRFPIAFPDQPEAQNIKERVEMVLEECLERLPGLKKISLVKALGKKERKKMIEDKKKAESLSRKKKVEYGSKADMDRRKKREIWGNVGVVEGVEKGQAEATG